MVLSTSRAARSRTSSSVTVIDPNAPGYCAPHLPHALLDEPPGFLKIVWKQLVVHIALDPSRRDERPCPQHPSRRSWLLKTFMTRPIALASAPSRV